MSLNSNCCACDETQGQMLMASSVLYSKMFYEVTGLKVNSENSLCKTCQHDLKVCYNFRKQCHEIFNLYENIKPLGEIGVESVEEVFFSSFDIQEERNVKNEEETIETDMEDNIEVLSEIEVEREWVPDNESNDSHREEWANDNRFKCTNCPKSFAKNSALRNHQMTHSNQRDFECSRPGCKSAFNVLCRLIRHLRNVHQADEDEIKTVRKVNVRLTPEKPKASPVLSESATVQCDVCLKVLSNVKYLKEHMMLQHLNNAPHSCDHKGCKKKFTNWSLLEKHKKKHEGIFDFKCKYCGKEYVQRKVLHQHLRQSHQIAKEEIDKMVRENTFCSKCNLAFKTTQQFSEHQALEHGTGDKFICDMCAKVFLSRIKLVSHQKYHREEKKVLCTSCPSSFTEERGLKTHLRRVHKLTVLQIYEFFMKNPVKK